MVITDLSLDTVDWGNPINWNSSLNAGLVGWWLAVPNRMGFGTLQWRDMLGRNHGTLTNMDPATDWVSPRGRTGGFGGLDADGDNDHVNLGDNFPLGTAALTISFWLYLTSHQAWGTPVCKGSTSVASSASHDFSVLFNNTANSVYMIRNGANRSPSTATFALNTWTHFVGVATDSETRMYFNTVLDSSQAGTGSGNTNNTAGRPLHFMEAPFGEAVGGIVDDIRIWNRSVSGAEVNWLYQESRQGYPNLLNRVPRRYYAPQAAADPVAKQFLFTNQAVQHAATY